MRTREEQREQGNESLRHSLIGWDYVDVRWRREARYLLRCVYNWNEWPCRLLRDVLQIMPVGSLLPGSRVLLPCPGGIRAHETFGLAPAKHFKVYRIQYETIVHVRYISSSLRYSVRKTYLRTVEAARCQETNSGNRRHHHLRAGTRFAPPTNTSLHFLCTHSIHPIGHLILSFHDPRRPLYSIPTRLAIHNS